MTLVILLTIMTLVWSVNFIIGKVALREFPVLTLVTLRALLSALILWPIFLFQSERGELRRLWEHRKLLLWMSIFGVIFNQGFFVAGLKNTSVAHSSIITSLTPVFVLIVARLHGLERFTVLKIAGLTTCMMGATVLTTAVHPAAIKAGPSIRGDLFAAGGSLAFAYFAVMGKEVTGRFSSLGLNTAVYTLGAMLFLPAGMFQIAQGAASHRSPAAWLSLVYMAAGASVAAYLIFYWALRRIAATRVTTLSYLQPVLVTLLGVFFLGEHITLRETAGAAVILAGVAMTERG